MKRVYSVSLLLFFFSCADKKTSSAIPENKAVTRKIVVPEFQTIIDSAGVTGSILIYDFKEDTFYSNDFQWAKKEHLPASTFKITNSIIALETGVVKNDSSLLKWNGARRRLKNWEQDLILQEAFHYSCVPCYQEIARKIGAQRMADYLNKLEFGTMKVDSTTIDLFWLEGESRITQFQQIDFLKRFYTSQLPISKRTQVIMKRMLVIEANDAYKLSGKTGWSISNETNNGWFVGYVETPNNTYFFASNLEPTPRFNMDLFPMIRKDVTLKAFKQMEWIN